MRAGRPCHVLGLSGPGRLMLVQTPDGCVHRIRHNATTWLNGSTYCLLAVVDTTKPRPRGRPLGNNTYVLVPAECLPMPQPLTCLACLAQEP